MSIPIRFLDYIKEKFKIIGNQMELSLDLFRQQQDTTNKLYNDIYLLKDNYKSIYNDFEIMKNENDLIKNELEIFKNDYIKLKNDIIQANNSDCTYLQEKPMEPRIFYDKYSCNNYLDKKLAVFLNLDVDTKMGFRDIMKLVYKYIEDNKLRNVMDIKIISPNLALKKLLGIDKKNVILTYANIQYYIQPMVKPILNKKI